MQSVAMQLIWAENLCMIDFRCLHATIMESFDLPRSTYTIDVRTTGVTNLGRTMRCIQVADRLFPDNRVVGRDMGDRLPFVLSNGRHYRLTARRDQNSLRTSTEERLFRPPIRARTKPFICFPATHLVVS